MLKHKIVIGLGALVVLIDAPNAAAHAASPARPAAVARCTTAQLVIAPDYGNGGAGHLGIIFLIHNRLNRTCTLYGYPGAQLLNANYQPLTTHLRWGGGYLGGNPPRRLVYLAPSADAYFSLEWVHIPSPGQTCPKASFLRITPPNDFEPT